MFTLRSPHCWASATREGGPGCKKAPGEDYLRNGWCQDWWYGPSWNYDWGTFQDFAPAGGAGADHSCPGAAGMGAWGALKWALVLALGGHDLISCNR